MLNTTCYTILGGLNPLNALPVFTALVLVIPARNNCNNDSWRLFQMFIFKCYYAEKNYKIFRSELICYYDHLLLAYFSLSVKLLFEIVTITYG